MAARVRQHFYSTASVNYASAGIHCARRSLDALVHVTPTHPAFSDRHPPRLQRQARARAGADGRVTANTE